MKFLGPTSSGSQADTVWSHNRYGQYTRRRAVPTNPSTSYQQDARSFLAATSAAWVGLTQAQRDGWNSWASTHPVVDSLGQTQYLTGHAFWVGVQTLLLRSIQPMIPAPPSAEPAWSTVATGLTATASGQVVSFAFSGLVVGEGLLLEMGPPQAPAVMYNGRWRLIGWVVASDTTPKLMSAAYTARWGAFSAGQWLPYRVTKVWWGVARQPPIQNVVVVS